METAQEMLNKKSKEDSIVEDRFYSNILYLSDSHCPAHLNVIGQILPAFDLLKHVRFEAKGTAISKTPSKSFQ